MLSLILFHLYYWSVCFCNRLQSQNYYFPFALPNYFITNLSVLQITHNHLNRFKFKKIVGSCELFWWTCCWFDQRQMKPDSMPEMQRCPLDIVVLKCKKLVSTKCPIRLLSTALDPPNLSNYEKTILKLKEVCCRVHAHLGKPWKPGILVKLSVISCQIGFCPRIFPSVFHS